MDARCERVARVIRIIPRPRVLLSVAAVAMLLTGCGTGPARPGAAAVVGGRTIPVSAVQQELNWLIDHVDTVRAKQENGKLPRVSRRILRGRVIHELVDVAARRVGLEADHARVEKLIDSSGGVRAAARSLGVSPRRLRELAVDQVLLESLGRYYIGRLSVSFVGTILTAESAAATAEEKAVELARRVAAHPQRARELFNSTGRPVRRTDLALRAALRRSPALATSAVFGALPGTVVVIKPNPRRSGWLVALVTERQVREQAEPAQRRNRTAGLYRVGVRMLQPIAQRLGVRINPRYGVWDPTAMRIVPSAEQVFGHQLRSRTVRS